MGETGCSPRVYTYPRHSRICMGRGAVITVSRQPFCSKHWNKIKLPTPALALALAG